jgi:hypothetical protein
MKINGVWDGGCKSWLAGDPINFVNALASCVQDAFPINSVPEDIQDRMKLLRKNADVMSRQFKEMLDFLKLYDLAAKIAADKKQKPAGNVATEEAPGGV